MLSSRISQRRFWWNSATQYRLVIELGRSTTAAALVCRRPARSVTRICSEGVVLKRWIGCSEGVPTEWQYSSSSSGMHEEAARCRAAYLGRLSG